MALRIIFMGTPYFAVPTLQALAATGHEIAAVYTQPPRPAGRGMAEKRSPVHDLALSLGLEVRTPASLRSAAEQEAFADLKADAAVVVAYGLLLPKAILDAPKFGCFNLHPSALPRWRGAAPLQRTLMAGDTETQVIIMRMDAGLDTGPICLAEPLKIPPDITSGELHDAAAERGAKLMVRALEHLEGGALKETPQSSDGVTYAPKIDKAEARIDFNRPASDVHNLIRGLSPLPGAWFEVGSAGKAQRLKVLRSKVLDLSAAPGEVLPQPLAIGCQKGAIQLIEVQRAGKRPMSAEEFLRGFKLAPGQRL
jgi:methionyl-tRNA formyltransferase